MPEPVREIKLSLYFEKLPESVSGVSCPMNRTVDDNYIVVIDGNRSQEDQLYAFLHEMAHIWNRDFERSGSVQEIEYRTHTQADSCIHNIITHIHI